MALSAMLPMASTPEQMVVHTAEWALLIVIVFGVFAFDLLSHVRKPHEPSMKESASYLALYCFLACVLGTYLWWRHGSTFGLEYFSVWGVEYSLSLDNIFVFIIIMGAFDVPKKLQQKVLFWGIVIALVLRFVFILLGKVIVSSLAWSFFIFGAFLLVTALSQIREGLRGEEDEDTSIADNFLVRIARKVFHVAEDYHGDKQVVKLQGKHHVTPLFLCIIAIGGIDLMFALDSIPASFGFTTEPFIIFAANAFALMGLRQMFFLVEGLLEKLVYLHFGLAAILGFIGLKLIFEAAHHYGYAEGFFSFNSLQSLLVIVVIIVITVISSFIASRVKSRKNALPDREQ
ncbi:TerC/Alx family metal homeostasis membrane protein [Actinotignum urinale]|uniref:TerC/Alx family metal homeostasis membrane protein n=1 Tax=Actinotignum urinale TaxID=190146 RepID=UPI0004040B7B|nr:TerC/Alx family metal homeostasis membrane protein [Actinotignum urinale]MDY5160221.1 TerC/Alx family metal homeostasis membrane protein [Actinotignum urinale]